MTNYPEFNPEQAPEDPAEIDLPSPFAEEEQPPSLEGMLFCSFLSEEDLTGANWDKPGPLPDLPRTMWDEPPVPEKAVLKAMADARAFANPGKQARATAPKAGRPESQRMGAAEPAASKFAGMVGRPTKNASPGLYGNLADTSWLEAERLKTAAHQGPAPLAALPVDEKLAVLEVVPAAHSGAAIAVPLAIIPSQDEKLSVLEAPAVEAPAQEAPAAGANAPGTETGSELLSETEAVHPQAEQGAGEVAGQVEKAPAAIVSPVAALEQHSSTRQELDEGLLEILSFRSASGSPQLAAVAVDVDEPASAAGQRPLFQSFYNPQPQLRTEIRIPHFGHLAVLFSLVIGGVVGSSLLTRAALHFHLWGVSDAQQAASDIHYTIGFMAGIYIIAFGLAAIVFPMWWHRGFFSGVQWNFAGARSKIWTLLSAACICFVLALVDEIVLPGPSNAPIDKMFDSRTAAWLLLIFGVTVAPFFEELIFRGFLLPALCTAFDWYGEKLNGNPPLPLDGNGHPQRSMPAMILAAIFTSIPFAGMHAEQTGYSIGPFVLLIAVSLVLCWARLRARSLAASVLVHASYNGLLFTIMLLGTGGFKHLDKM